MDPLTTYALIAGGGNLLSSGISAFGQSQTNKQMMEYNTAQWQREAAFQREMLQKQMDFNSYPGQVKQMQEAGLNPALMYGNAGSTSISAPASPHQSAPALANPYQPFAEFTEKTSQMATNIAMAKSQIRQQEAMTYKTLAEIPKITSEIQGIRASTKAKLMETANLEMEAALKRMQYSYQGMFYDLERQEREAGIELLHAQTKQVFGTIALQEVQGKYTNAQLNNAALEYEKNRTIWDKCADWMVQAVKAQSDGDYYKMQQDMYQAKELMYKTGVMDNIGTYTDFRGSFGAMGVVAPLMDVTIRANKKIAGYADKVVQMLSDLFTK